MIRRNKNKSILVISDMHIPAHHPDTFKFLEAIKRKYRPDRVVSIGDEVDKHAMSFHDSDPDLPSAGDELQQAIEYLKKLYKIFPKVDVVESNHGSMVYRKGKHHGIPRKYLRDYGDVLEAPKEWKWHNKLIIKASDGEYIKFIHQVGKNPLKAAQCDSMNTVQGHHHTEFNIQYHSSPERLIWAVTVGCLIDDEAYHFLYNKTTPTRPIIGCSIIIDGQPKLIPMILNKKGRWIGKLRG